MKLLQINIRPECSEYHQLYFVRLRPNLIYAWRTDVIFNYSVNDYLPKELGL